MSQAFSGIEAVPQVQVLAELEHAAVIQPAKIDLLLRNFVPQLLAIVFTTFILGATVGVLIGLQATR